MDDEDEWRLAARARCDSFDSEDSLSSLDMRVRAQLAAQGTSAAGASRGQLAAAGLGHPPLPSPRGSRVHAPGGHADPAHQESYAQSGGGCGFCGLRRAWRAAFPAKASRRAKIAINLTATPARAPPSAAKPARAPQTPMRRASPQRGGTPAAARSPSSGGSFGSGKNLFRSRLKKSGLAARLELDDVIKQEGESTTPRDGGGGRGVVLAARAASFERRGGAASFADGSRMSSTGRELSADERRAKAAFEAFLAGRDVPEVTKAYGELQSSLCAIGAAGEPAQSPAAVEAAATDGDGRVNSTSLAQLLAGLATVLPHKSKQLLSALERRSVQGHYQPSCSGVRVAIVGAGPVGLRTAIELAFLGAHVQVLESRGAFTRLQVLHLWDWVESDLIDLGIKFIDPSIFAAADFKHVGTAQLQHSLLKVALLLGVQMKFDCTVNDLRSLNAHLAGGGAAAAGAPSQLRPPLATTNATASNAARSAATRPNGGGPHKPAHSRAIGGAPGAHHATVDDGRSSLPDVLLDATGARCELFETLGFNHGTVLKSARALCIVMHLANEKTAEEMRISENTWCVLPPTRTNHPRGLAQSTPHPPARSWPPLPPITRIATGRHNTTRRNSVSSPGRACPSRTSSTTDRRATLHRRPRYAIRPCPPSTARPLRLHSPPSWPTPIPREAASDLHSAHLSLSLCVSSTTL